MATSRIIVNYQAPECIEVYRLGYNGSRKGHTVITHPIEMGRAVDDILWLEYQSDVLGNVTVEGYDGDEFLWKTIRTSPCAWKKAKREEYAKMHPMG